MSSILSDTAKLAGWTLGATILVAAFVSSPEGQRSLAGLRDELAANSAPPAPIMAPPPNAQGVQDQPAPSHFGDEADISVGPGGNFFTDAEIDGELVHMIVDTGASAVVLSFEQAGSLGFHPDSSEFRYASQTANGRTFYAKVTLPYVRVGQIQIDDVTALVGAPGAIGTDGLLGMTFLGRLQSYQVLDGRLVLRN